MSLDFVVKLCSHVTCFLIIISLLKQISSMHYVILKYTHTHMYSTYNYNIVYIYIYLYRLNPEKYFIDKLTAHHVDYIADYWTDKTFSLPVITKYLQNIFTAYNFSIGIFPRSHPSYPVSWVIYSDYGHSMFLYTIPEYRGNGFGGITKANLYSSLLKNCIYPLGECTRDSYPSKKFSHVEKCFPGYTWRDSVTGECYW